MKKDKFSKNDEENPTKMDSYNNLKEEENPGDFYSNIFAKIPMLIPYKKEIMSGILKSKDKFFSHANFDSKREDYILKCFRIIKEGLEEYNNQSSFFSIAFLSTKISDEIIFFSKGNINKKEYKLIYHGSVFIAAKCLTQYFIPYIFDEGNNDKVIITLEEIRNYENTINRLFNYEYNMIYPTDILCIYQLLDGTYESKGITKHCRFLFIFLLFSRAFIDKEKNVVVLTVYYYSKILKDKHLNWSQNLEDLTEIDKKTVVQNINKLIMEIKNNYEIYIYLEDNFYDII